MSTISEIEKAWMDEADRRWQEIKEGKVKCIPAEEVMKQARDALKKENRLLAPKSG